MTDYKVGYGKPPRGAQFKPGASGNPKGTRKRWPSGLAEIIREAVSDKIEYSEGGRDKVAPALKISAESLVSRAKAGDLDAIDTLFRAVFPRGRGKKRGALSIIVEDWLPDAPIGPADPTPHDDCDAAGDDGDAVKGHQEAPPTPPDADPSQGGAQ